MAASQIEKVKEDFLTCMVSSDSYTDPCTLACQHSFCRECLTDYIKTKPDAVKSKTIPCPCCLQETRVPNPSRPVEEWAGQMKLGLVLGGLIDTFKQGTVVEGKSDAGPCCGICEHLGETTPATFWCQECEALLCEKCRRAHRASPASRNHEVDDLSKKVKVKRRRKVACKEHKDEIVKFHCKDCKKSACHTCCVIHHRACTSVVTIESMKSEMKSLLSGKRLALSKRLKVRTKRVKDINSSINETTQKKLEMLTEIQSVSQQAIQKIREKEKQLTDKVNEATVEQITQLRADLKTEEIEMQSNQQQYEFIDYIFTSECVEDMYNMFQACESETWLLEESNERVNRRQIDKISLSQDRAKYQKVLADMNFGDVNITYKLVSDTISSPVLYQTIDGGTESDETSPCLEDITIIVLHGMVIVVATDSENNCVKSFYSENDQSFQSKQFLSNAPYSVTKLKENLVMVTVPNSLQISTLEITPKVLLHSSFTTSGEYYSLAVLGPTSLAAGGSNPGCVDILNMDGQVMKSVSTYNNVELFEDPDYMWFTNKGNLLVSDHEKKSVTCLTPEGMVMWTYSPTGAREIINANGVTSTNKGDILLVDRDAVNVIQLTETGQYVRDMLTSQDGLTDPRDICIDDYGSVFMCKETEIKEFIFV